MEVDTIPERQKQPLNMNGARVMKGLPTVEPARPNDFINIINATASFSPRR
ncbi:hypothetical protein [Bradyrhizobium elkanii]|uniref:hypothetical protein n=1 Tax=Bradyrhizobium elkanii TaxID=29448 RepID=UPI0021685C1C|nr:hypothetical protein [Bradyrhizobium elkanii]MCS3521845.1 hypothetical protein [Bradyrhizobium elkanii]MCS4069500.1 hypothetical protein [Bradyrhizobium elkanii]MCS4076130.1 hypothetical protein [Bradyrhizobium elkanii]